jgi:hypothetical protein
MTEVQFQGVSEQGRRGKVKGKLFVPIKGMVLTLVKILTDWIGVGMRQWIAIVDRQDYTRERWP